jgi:hypothetical protein
MFIISPRIGLCNQLQTIVKGILLGIKYNRDIYIDKFQIHLYDNNFCDINEILNISKINEYLKSQGVTIKILKNIDQHIINNLSQYFLPNIDYSKVAYSSYINSDIEENLHKNIIYLGNIVSLDLYKSFNYIYRDYTNMFHLIMTNIIFHDKFYEIKEKIKTNLKLVNYSTIHLRIEDDAIKHFANYYKLSIDQYNNNLLDFYSKVIEESKQPIYICSGILSYDNKINYNYYDNLMKNNKLLCDKRTVPINEYYLNNRELIAIIDLLIAYDSDNFIGCGISSFTQTIKTYLKVKKNIDSVII